MARRFRKKHLEREVARRRIERLFDVAHRRVQEGDLEWGRRSVDLARRIAMRYQTGLSPDLRDRFCTGCQGPLVPGHTARIRVGGGKKSITCLACGEVRRRPYVREQKARRRARELVRTKKEPEALVVNEEAA